jgi:hypothetical protein
MEEIKLILQKMRELNDKMEANRIAFNDYADMVTIKMVLDEVADDYFIRTQAIKNTGLNQI